MLPLLHTTVARPWSRWKLLGLLHAGGTLTRSCRIDRGGVVVAARAVLKELHGTARMHMEGVTVIVIDDMLRGLSHCGTAAAAAVTHDGCANVQRSSWCREYGGVSQRVQTVQCSAVQCE